MSLYSRLAVIFISIALVSVIVISLIANISTGLTFRKYVSEKQNKRNELIINILKSSYERRGEFDALALNEIDMYAMMDNLKVGIKDNSGTVLWGVNYIEHNPILPTPNKASNGIQKKYVESEIPIVKDKNKIGTLVIGFYGDYTLPSNEVWFMNSFNKWLIFSGLISVAIAFLLSSIVSKHIATPIVEATEIAHSIKDGDLQRRLDAQSGTKEISEFAQTINHLAQSLENQEKLRKQLTSDVAHELRTPLATLQSHVEAILDGVWEPTKDRMESIHEEITRLSKLVKDIERATEIENEVIKIDKTEFDITELFLNIKINFEPQAANKGIEIIINTDQPVEVFGDRDKLNQVIVNLFSNAVKYTDAGGKIAVDIFKNSDNVEFVVKDTGIGIEDEHLPHIFERFYRADSSRTRATGGAGIGLAITKSIVLAHGGSIKVKSEKGIGTEFKVSIPAKV